MLNIKSLFNRKRVQALKTLSELDSREGTAARNAAANDAHTEKRIAELSAKTGTPAPKLKIYEMVVPPGYVGTSKPSATAESTNTHELSALRAENATLKSLVAKLEGAKTAPTKPVNFVALAEKLYPDDLTSLRRICETPDELSNRCGRLFYLDNLASLVGGIDVAQMKSEFGEPRKPFGLERARLSVKRDNLIEMLAGIKPAAVATKPQIDPKLTGLEKAYAAHAAANAGNLGYARCVAN